MMVRAVRPAVWFVAGEQRAYPAGAVARQGHQCAADMTKELRPVSRQHPTSRVEFEDEHGVVVCDRLHQAKAAESAVADDDWTANRLAESDFHVPQRVFGEARPGREELGANSSRVEGFPLHADVRRSGSNAGATKGLNDSAGSPLLLLVPLIRGLVTRSSDAASLCIGQCDRRHAAEHDGRFCEPVRHSGVVGGAFPISRSSV